MVPQTDTIIHFQHLQINQFDLKNKECHYCSLRYVTHKPYFNINHQVITGQSS